MNRSEIVALANKARTDVRTARGAFKKLATAEGYTGASGGWIYYRDSRTATTQGWQGLADLVGRGMVRFSLAEARDEQDRRAAEAEVQLEEADAAAETPAFTVVEHTDARDVQPGDIVTIKPLNGAAYRMHVVTNTPGAWEQVRWLCGVVITKDGSAHKTRNRYPLNTEERDTAETVIGRRAEIGLKKAVAPTELRKVERPAVANTATAPVAKPRKPRKLQGRKMSPAMRKLAEEAGANGFLSSWRGTVAQMVGLMDRGIIRELHPRDRRHYLTTLPAQVWEEAHAENARWDAEHAPDPRGTHATHCCKRHGCKYGDATCPVVGRKVAQEYPCEQCDGELNEAHEEARRANALLDNADALYAFVRKAFLVDRYRTPRAEQVKLMWKMAHQGVELPGLETSGRAASRYTSPVGGMAMLGPELPGMLADAAYYASKADAPAEKATGASDQTAIALTDVNNLRMAVGIMEKALRWNPSAEVAAALDRIEAALRATKATHIVGGVELPAGMDWATYERLMSA